MTDGVLPMTMKLVLVVNATEALLDTKVTRAALVALASVRKWMNE